MKRGVEQTVVLRETTFIWRVHREPQWCTTDGWKGLAILVELVGGEGSALIIEFPFAIQARRSTPQRQRPSVSRMELERAIAAALDGGWEPRRRGKPRVFEVQSARGGDDN